MKPWTPLLALLTFSACRSTPVPGAPNAPRARAVLSDVSGREVAYASLESRPGGVLIRLEAEGLAPGTHALHIHETGRCAPDFEAAGAHYNPGGKEHGLRNPKGAHAGDLPSLFMPASGKAEYSTVAPAVLGALLEGDGSALVIHAGADDGVSQPGGGAGERVACGVITRE